MTDTPNQRNNTALNNAIYTPLSPVTVQPLPIPRAPLNVRVYPQNMNDLNTAELSALYTNLAQLVAHAGYSLARVESAMIEKRHELDKAVTLRFVHDTETRSTTERKERARCTSKTMALQSQVSVLNQDATVIRALLEGYKTQLFSVKSELERRRHE